MRAEKKGGTWELIVNSYSKVGSHTQQTPRLASCSSGFFCMSLHSPKLNPRVDDF